MTELPEFIYDTISNYLSVLCKPLAMHRECIIQLFKNTSFIKFVSDLYINTDVTM